jgi:microcystin degradation protein MlrC
MAFTVLTAEVSHETNTFNVNPTDYSAFAETCLLLGEDALTARGAGNTDLAGFRDVALREGWHCRHVISAAARPGGIVTHDAFERITAPILDLASAHRAAFDGVLLGLHGAMVTEDDQDGEGALLSRLRAILGRDMPIAITLDLHANVTARMCDLADIVISYKTYPHVDMRDCGRHAAGLLHRAMRGEIAPRTLRVHRPMLEEVNGGRTDVGPMIQRLAKARAYEAEPGVYAVSVNAGFGNADIAEIGPSVLVTYEDGDAAAHRAFANAIADDIWDRRRETLNSYLSVEEAAERCLRHDPRVGPLVVADYADNPGGGAYGDSTALLAGLLAAGVANACLAPLVDPRTAAALQRCSVGEAVRVSLGGKTDPRFGGGPLDLTGTLISLSDGAYVGDGPMLGGLAGSWGPCGVLRVAGVDILVTTRRQQMLDLQQLKAVGIEPAEKAVLALKSMQHFRAAFEPVAAEVIVCDSGALCSPDLTRLPYKNTPIPTFPLQDD